MSTPVLDHIKVIKVFCDEYEKVDALIEDTEAMKDAKKEYIKMIVGQIEQQLISIKLYI